MEAPVQAHLPGHGQRNRSPFPLWILELLTSVYSAAVVRFVFTLNPRFRFMRNIETGDGRRPHHRVDLPVLPHGCNRQDVVRDAV